MAIRKNTNPRMMDLQPEMQDILRRNGMQAHVVSDGTGYRLVVQGHDSPLLTYDLTERQMLALTDWGTNSANKKAYNVFTSIVGKDFYMPKNFVHARNANGRVAMGLHGYRIGIGEYGHVGRLGMPPPFLGWTPRHQWGFHLRRVGGQLFYPGPPIVPERWDGRMKPGELQSGGYGFYYKYKAGQPVQPAQQADVLQNLQTVITPLVSRPRSTEPARTYKELISSPVYFSNDQWQECLSSHGIIIDEKAKTLTIQSESTKSDMVYDLTDDELKALTNNSVKQVSVAKRLDILNNVIKDDFTDKITMDMLNSKERIHIGLRPEVQQELDGKMQLQSTVEPLQVQQEPMNNKVGIVDGQDLDESKGWFREGKHGREVTVGEIQVEPAEQEGKFRMTAIINGERVSHEITQKQYDKFMAVDDYHRMKLFSKIFGEVDMKDRSSLGTKIGAALLAGLGVAAEVGSELHRPHGAPVVIVDHHHGAAPAPPRPYFKPGVDTPMDVAARNFEAAMNQEVLHPHMGKGL